MNTQKLLSHASYGLILAGALSAQAARAADDPLVPAIAFALNGSAVLRDVAIDGTFPQAFRLRDLPPPPAEVLADRGFAAIPEAEPAFHFARIVAVPRDHPPVLLRPKSDSRQSDCSETGCTDEVRVCAADDASRCTEVVLACNVVGKDCRISSIDGDPELLRQSLRLLAGSTSQHALLYLATDAPAGSLVSQFYGSGAALGAGYHLLELRESSEASQEKFMRCELDAHQIVLKQYSQELGRSFTNLTDLFDHLALARVNEKNGTQHEQLKDLGFDDDVLDAMGEVLTAFHSRVLVDMIGRKCLLDASGFGVVGAPASRTLTVPLADPTPPKVGDVFLVGTPWRVGNPPFDWP